MLRNNPAYNLATEHDGIRFYVPANIADPETGYHLSRFVEATNQQIYANAGATKDVLQLAMDEIILRCNKDKSDETMRTDVAAIAQSIKYRLQYPVDEDCALRVGAILTFMETDTESENPNKYEAFWTNKKLTLAKQHPDLYAFFLTLGISNIPTYAQHFDTSIDLDSFQKRREMIQSLLPGGLSKIA